MRSSIKTLIFALATVSIASTPVLAQVATFDDLPGGRTVPPGYIIPGSVWSNWLVLQPALALDPPGKDACAVTNPNCAANGFGTLASITSGTAFDFTGGYFLGWVNYDCFDPSTCPVSLTVTGYNGATVVGSSTNLLDSYATQWLAFNFSNVDHVDFQTNTASRAYYLADNLTFNQNATTVPEPASMALLGTGLVGVFGAARRRFSKTA